METFNWQEFFNNLKDKDGNHIEIPLTGSMGLLALGDLGVIAWKLRREAHTKMRVEQITENKKNKK